MALQLPHSLLALFKHGPGHGLVMSIEAIVGFDFFFVEAHLITAALSLDIEAQLLEIVHVEAELFGRADEPLDAVLDVANVYVHYEVLYCLHGILSHSLNLRRINTLTIIGRYIYVIHI